MFTFAELQELVQKYGLGVAFKIVCLFVVGSVAPLILKRIFKFGWPEHYLVRHRLIHANRVLFSVMNDLTKHAFFVTHLNALHMVIPHIAIEDNMRRVLFKDLLTMYVQTFYDNMLNFISSTDLDGLDQQTFQQAMCKLYTDTISEFEGKCVLSGIPQIVMDKFSDWHAGIRETSMSFLTQATSSNFYTSNRVRMIAILDWFTASLQVTLLNAEKTLGELNGQLDGTVYKGVTAVHVVV